MFVFDKKTLRYRSKKTGKFVSEENVLKELDNHRESKTLDMLKHLDDYRVKKDANKLLTALAQEIKQLWLVEYAVGKGGIKAITNKEFQDLNLTIVGQLTRTFDPDTETTYGLFELVNAFEREEISYAQMQARLKMYARASRVAFWQGKDKATKKPYMQRFLGDAVHCAECLSYANLGMVVKGKLPLPLQKCTCRSNCKCTVKYFTETQYTSYLKNKLSNFGLLLI